MTTYRKATLEEIQKFVKQNEWAKYIDKIDIKDICTRIKDFFPPELSYIVLEYGDEYNDEGYDLKIRDILGYDVNNNELDKNFGDKIKDPANYYNNQDKYWDMIYQNELGRTDGDSEHEFTIKIDVDKQEVIPDSKQDIEFYVKS